MPYYAPFYRPIYTPMQNAPDNSQFGQYQQPMQPQQMPLQPPTMPYTGQNQQSNDFVWVQGEAGAKAYLVAPNATVTLWDSESSTIYIKSADANGMPSMRILDFAERTQNAPKSPQEHDCKCGKEFVSQEKFDALRLKFDDLTSKYESLTEKIDSMTTKSKKTVKEDPDNG